VSVEIRAVADIDFGDPEYLDGVADYFRAGLVPSRREQKMYGEGLVPVELP